MPGDTIPQSFTVPLIEYTRVAAQRDALSARVARYEKALNYYANAKLYKGGFDNDGDGHFDQYGYGILDDEGETARHALADGGKP